VRQFLLTLSLATDSTASARSGEETSEASLNVGGLVFAILFTFVVFFLIGFICYAQKTKVVLTYYITVYDYTLYNVALAAKFNTR
jgi:hypothetical protein